MIGRILKSGSYGSKVDYITRVRHDHTIFTPDTWKILGSRGLMGEKRNQIIASFEAQAMQNRRIGNPAGHITLSFSADDKPKLSDEKMLKIAKDYIHMMGLDKTQYLIVRHYETDKPHCHIVFNMVGDNGKRMESGRNRYRNKKVCEALTKRYRLAFPKQETPDLGKLHGVERAKVEIRIAATEALSHAKDWHTFAALLAKKNIRIMPKYRRGTTEMQGVSFQLGDYKVKGSDVGEAFKFRNLDRYFNDLNRETTGPEFIHFSPHDDWKPKPKKEGPKPQQQQQSASEKQKPENKSLPHERKSRLTPGEIEAYKAMRANPHIPEGAKPPLPEGY